MSNCVRSRNFFKNRKQRRERVLRKMSNMRAAKISFRRSKRFGSKSGITAWTKSHELTHRYQENEREHQN